MGLAIPFLEPFVTVENNKTGEKIDLSLEQLISSFIELEKYRKNNISLEEILSKL